MLKGRGGRSQSESVNSRNGCNGIIRSDKIEEEKPRRERDTGEETVGYQVNTGETFQKKKKIALNQKELLTGEVFQALASVAALSAAAAPVVLARPRVAKVDLRLAVVAGEADGAAAAQPVDGVDGAEQNRVGRDERRRAVELEHRHALHVVLAGLAQANVVVERQNLQRFGNER